MKTKIEKPLEKDLQKDCFNWFAETYYQGCFTIVKGIFEIDYNKVKELKRPFFNHTANENYKTNKSNKIYGMLYNIAMKKEGRVKGFPDIQIVKPSDTFEMKTCFIELKRQGNKIKKGSEQEAVCNYLNARVVYTLQEFKEIVKEFLKED
jgi:hypothetical protein